jgi:hypothetical protein
VAARTLGCDSLICLAFHRFAGEWEWGSGVGDAAPGGEQRDEKAVERVVESALSGSRSDCASRPATGRQETARQGPRRKIRRRIVALLLVVAAGGAGIAHAVLGQAASGGTPTVPTTCAAPVKATEQLTIHAHKQPAYVDLKTDITVKLGTAVARDLLASATSGDLGGAFPCYFQDFYKAPTFLSAGNGLATFSDETNDQNVLGRLLSPGSGWSGSLKGRTIALQFSSATACGSLDNRYLPDWAGAPLALTVDSDAPPSALSPMPDSHSGSSYTWSFSRLNCKAPPGIKISIPISLPAYLATEVNNETALGGLGLFLAGWSGEIILLLFAVFFWVRHRRAYADAGLGFYLVAVTALGFVAVAANSLRNGPLPVAAILAGVYGVFFALSLTRPLWGRLLIGAAAAGLAAFLLWLSYSRTLGDDVVAARTLGVALFAESCAAILAIGGGLCTWGRLRRVVFAGVLRGADGPLAKFLDLAILYGGTAIAAAAAFSVGDLQTPLTLINSVYSEISVLQYFIPAFSSVLIAAALVIPFVAGGPGAGRWQLWYGLLGFAALAQLPDPAIGYATIPVAEILFAVILAWMCANKAPEPDLASGLSKLRTCTPRDNPLDNTRLAVKISAILAIVPVAYFAATAISNLPHSLQNSTGAIFLVAGILSQLAGWLAAGVIFSIINNRLPGWCGPVRALIVCIVWFAVGFTVNGLQDWLQPGSGGRSWTFFGLQLLLFLIAFGVIWDACILDGGLSWSSVDRLREAYRIQQARSLALYAIPLLLALIALGQQVVSGNGVEFVKSALSVVPAVLGG